MIDRREGDEALEPDRIDFECRFCGGDHDAVREQLYGDVIGTDLGLGRQEDRGAK